jgi:hypothetical protein
MLKLIVTALFIGDLAGAGAAHAGQGQCYAADGRATGPAFDSAAPDREWIRYVILRGGRCTGTGEEAASKEPLFTEHEVPNHRHLLRFQRMQRED